MEERCKEKERKENRVEKIEREGETENDYENQIRMNPVLIISIKENERQIYTSVRFEFRKILQDPLGFSLMIIRLRIRRFMFGIFQGSYFCFF